MKHRRKARKASSLRWLLFFLAVADGLVCGILTSLFYSSMLPSVEVVLADSAPTATQVPVREVSSFELGSRKETQELVASNGETFTLIEASPTPNLTPSQTAGQAPTPPPTDGPSPVEQALEPVNELVSTGGSSVVALTTGSLPESTAILPPCGPGEEFYRTVDGRGFDVTYVGDQRSPRFHAGIDGGCRSDGQGKWLAYAVADSRVVAYEFLNPGSSQATELWSSGWTVVLTFTFEGVEYEAIYGHLEFPNKSENWPKVGDLVGPASPLGRIGSTGASSGLHLHFGLRRRGVDGNFTFVNPEDYGVLGKRP